MWLSIPLGVLVPKYIYIIYFSNLLTLKVFDELANCQKFLVSSRVVSLGLIQRTAAIRYYFHLSILDLTKDSTYSSITCIVRDGKLLQTIYQGILSFG
jgi:hypothetical protein